MLNSVLSSILLGGSLVLGALASAPLVITNSPNVTAKSCEAFTFTWEGGIPPYVVQIHYLITTEQGPAFPVAFDTMIMDVNTTHFTTIINVPPNATSDEGIPGFVRFGVWDLQVNRTEFPLFNQPLAAGNSTSCLPGLALANDTTPESPFTQFSIAGPGPTIEVCNVAKFKVSGEIEGRPVTLTTSTVNLANNAIMLVSNIVSTNFSLKFPFPPGTSFTTAAGDVSVEVASDIQRTVLPGKDTSCVTPSPSSSA